MCRRASRWLLGTLSVLQLHFSQASLGASAVDALQRTRKLTWAVTCDPRESESVPAGPHAMLWREYHKDN